MEKSAVVTTSLHQEGAPEHSQTNELTQKILDFLISFQKSAKSGPAVADSSGSNLGALSKQITVAINDGSKASESADKIQEWLKSINCQWGAKRGHPWGADRGPL